LRWAAPEILDDERPVSKESDIYSFAMVVIEAFTGKAPFHGIPPTTVAVGVLAGNRPTRPMHMNLTNNLWEMIKRCWSQNPQKRPEISEVVLCLRATLALRHDRVGLDDDRAQAGMTSGSTQRRGLSLGLRFWPSRWTSVSSILRRLSELGKFSPALRSTSDAEPTSGCREKHTDRRHQSSSVLSKKQRKEGLPYRVARRLRISTAHRRSKTKAVAMHDTVPLTSNRTEKHSMPLTFKRSLMRWTKCHVLLRAYSKSV